MKYSKYLSLLIADHKVSGELAEPVLENWESVLAVSRNVQNHSDISRRHRNATFETYSKIDDKLF